MTYTEQFLKQLTQCGMLGYSASKCMNILDVNEADEKQFLKDFSTAGSQIHKAYVRGIDKADYAIDTALFKKAAEGDKKAYEMLEERKYRMRE